MLGTNEEQRWRSPSIPLFLQRPLQAQGPSQRTILYRHPGYHLWMHFPRLIQRFQRHYFCLRCHA